MGGGALMKDKIGSRTPFNRGFCHRAPKKENFVETHSSIISICSYTPHILFYSIKLERQPNDDFAPYLFRWTHARTEAFIQKHSSVLPVHFSPIQTALSLSLSTSRRRCNHKEAAAPPRAARAWSPPAARGSACARRCPGQGPLGTWRDG